MSKISIITLLFMITACEVELNNSDSIEFSGNHFTYEEKLEIAKEAISSTGIEGLTAHILSEVPEVKSSEIEHIDIRVIESSNNRNFVLRCHIETQVSLQKNEKLIESCKKKLFNLLQEAESKRKST